MLLSLMHRPSDDGNGPVKWLSDKHMLVSKGASLMNDGGRPVNPQLRKSTAARRRVAKGPRSRGISKFSLPTTPIGLPVLAMNARHAAGSSLSISLCEKSKPGYGGG